MFRKREIKRDSIRKIRTVAEEEEEEEDLNATEEVEQLELLREMRSEQKDRRRDAGIDTSKLMNASERAVKEKERAVEEEALGQQQQDSGPNLKALMSNQFTEQVGLMQADDKVHEKRMEDFIDEQMGVVKDQDPACEKPSVSRAKTEEDQLYVIKDVAKIEDVANEGITGNAAPLFMNTGLAEVALPVDFRLRNIERTADAKAAIQAKRDVVFQRRDHREGKHNDASRSVDIDIAATSGRYGGSSALGGGSFNSNFNTHRREWAVMMKNKEGGTLMETNDRKEGKDFDGTCNTCGKAGHRSRDCRASSAGGGGRGGGEGGKGGNVGKGAGGKPGAGGGGGARGSSSDDRVFEQYKKKARR
mmetsp:Transcript_63583/g.124826  ORF Transcript_63583/g.124826 Transcript_63583/m.124826 type:complete len:361 (-) Transcript_63583:182-1264(-)